MPVVHYKPHRIARQFGLDKDVPTGIKMTNKMTLAREIFLSLPWGKQTDLRPGPG